MAFFSASASRSINVSPDTVYNVLRDYEVGHPAILPKAYFEKVEIEQGGQGAGTIIHVYMKLLGIRQTLRMEVTEPKPYTLVEVDMDNDTHTTFTVEPLEGGRKSKVTIQTKFKSKGGIQGFFERMFLPSILGGIFHKELDLLAKYVKQS